MTNNSRRTTAADTVIFDMKRRGLFFVQNGALYPVGVDGAKMLEGLDGQMFTATLDDEQPVNDARRAALFATVRDWIDNRTPEFMRAFWRNFHGAAPDVSPVDAETVVAVLKKMHGIGSIANGAISDDDLAEFFAFVNRTLDHVAAIDYGLHGGG